MEDFVTYEIAKKLEEKGFNIPTLIYYKELGCVTCLSGVKCPTISQVLRWLRDKFFLHISQKPYLCEDGLMCMYEIRKFNKYTVFVIANKTGFVEAEESLLAGIEYVLDKLI